MSFAYEAQIYAFERECQRRLDAETVTLVPLWTGGRIRNQVFEVELPDAETMAGFDTLEIDAAVFCPEHLDENCGEWDRKSHLWVCDRPVEPNAHAETACQPHVPGDEENEAIPAETRPCGCSGPLGSADAQQTCNAEGTGFADCACPCGTELARGGSRRTAARGGG